MDKFDIAAWYLAFISHGGSRRRLWRRWQNENIDVLNFTQNSQSWHHLWLKKKPPEILNFKNTITQFRKELECAQENSFEIITVNDKDWPARLHHLSDPPLVIFYKGTRALLTKTSLSTAIVGARDADPLWVNTLLNCVMASPAHHGTIISGLARGVDAAAHEWSIEKGFGTIAIIAGGIEKLSGWQKELSKKICCNGGVVASEYFPFSPPHDWEFAERNRLVAALSHRCLVVAATEKSGSLITAKISADLGRDVFVIPHGCDSPWKGSLSLLSQGAMLCYSPSCWPETPHIHSENLSNVPINEEDEFFQILSLLNTPLRLDEISKKLSLSLEETQSILCRAERKKIVKCDELEFWSREHFLSNKR
jgi:DNA processing protein